MFAAVDLINVYLGDRLGLYRALAERGPAKAAELAYRTGVRDDALSSNRTPQ